MSTPATRARQVRMMGGGTAYPFYKAMFVLQLIHFQPGQEALSIVLVLQAVQQDAVEGQPAHVGMNVRI